MSRAAIRRANRLVKQGDTAAAEKALTDAMEKTFRDPRLAIRRGVITSSAEDFANAVKIDPGNRAARYFMGLMALEKGDSHAAIPYLEEALKISPDNVSVRILLALCRIDETGLAPLAKLEPLLPAATARTAAVTLFTLEKLIATTAPGNTGAEEADNVLKGVIGWFLDRLDDFSAIVYWALSHTLNIVLNISDSRRRKVYRLVTEGDRLAAFRKPDEAAICYEKALAIDPANPESLESLVSHHIHCREFDTAAAYLDRLAEVDKDNFHIKRWRADILFAGGDFAGAGTLYDELAADDMLDYFVRYRRGLCCLRTGDDGRAIKYFEESLRLVNHCLLPARLRFAVNISDKAGTG